MYVYSSPYIIITILVQKAQKDGRIPNAPGYAGLLGQISSFRSSLTSVAAYGHIPVPLVYTQVVTLAVYVYFIVALIGEQWIIWRSDIKVFYFIYNFTLMFGEHGWHAAYLFFIHIFCRNNVVLNSILYSKTKCTTTKNLTEIQFTITQNLGKVLWNGRYNKLCK